MKDSYTLLREDSSEKHIHPIAKRIEECIDKGNDNIIKQASEYLDKYKIPKKIDSSIKEFPTNDFPVRFKRSFIRKNGAPFIANGFYWSNYTHMLKSPELKERDSEIMYSPDNALKLPRKLKRIVNKRETMFKDHKKLIKDAYKLSNEYYTVDSKRQKEIVTELENMLSECKDDFLFIKNSCYIQSLILRKYINSFS